MVGVIKIKYLLRDDNLLGIYDTQITQYKQKKRMPQKYQKALKYLNSAKFSKAIKLFEEIFQNQSTSNQVVYSYQSFLNMCIAYIQAGRFQKAKQVCSNLIKISPEAYQVYGVLAISLAYLGEYNQAIKICNKGLEQNNKNWKLFYSKGFVYAKMNKYQQASENYGLAITKNLLNNPKCYIFQSYCMANLGLVDNAIKNMNYANTAITEDENKNCRDLFKYEIQNIKNRLKIFQKYNRKLDKATSNNQLTPSQRQKSEKQLIKIIGKSLQYNATIDISKKKHEQIQQNTQNTKNKQVTSQANQLQQKKQQASDTLSVQLQKLDKTINIQTKNSLNSEQLQNNSKSNKIACQWLREKCCIY